MTEDLDVLLLWYRVVCVICSLTTTAVPILYSFTPWRTRLFGKLFMVQAISFAIAMDFTTLFAFWRPTSILIVFWVSIGMLSLIGISTSGLAIMMFVIPYRVRRNVRNGFQQEGV
jgi:hypothetical protein